MRACVCACVRACAYVRTGVCVHVCPMSFTHLADLTVCVHVCPM